MPLHFHKVDEASGGLSERERERNQTDHISGRSIGPLQLLRYLIKQVKDLFQMLGLIINNKKSQLEPSQELVFLGLAISTVSIMQVYLPKEKVAQIQQEAKQLHSKLEVSVQKLATFVGMTTAATQAIRAAPLFHWHLQTLINRVVPLASSIEKVKQ